MKSLPFPVPCSLGTFALRASIFSTTLCLALPLAPALADDWPQWGATQARNMYSPAKGLPAQFDPGKLKPGTEEVDLKTTKNVKWVAKLGSQSYGNVTVANG